MANYCNFVIDVQGEAESLDRFASYFMDSIKEDAGNPRNEVFVPLDDGTFGDFDAEKEVRYLWMPKGKEIQWTESGEIRIVGWCNWEPPITWLESVSNLMPGLSFNVCNTIEHELFQHWDVADGHADLRKQDYIPLK